MFIDSTNLHTLTSLTLAGTAPSGQCIPAKDFQLAFQQMTQLTSLTYAAYDYLTVALLSQLHHAPSLRTVTITYSGGYGNHLTPQDVRQYLERTAETNVHVTLAFEDFPSPQAEFNTSAALRAAIEHALPGKQLKRITL
jgi:hypothetical protein